MEEALTELFIKALKHPIVAVWILLCLKRRRTFEATVILSCRTILGWRKKSLCFGRIFEQSKFQRLLQCPAQKVIKIFTKTNWTLKKPTHFVSKSMFSKKSNKQFKPSSSINL